MGTHEASEATLVTDVYHCARCGQDHKGIIFLKFMVYPIESEGYIYDYWGFCPTYNEPIILSKTRKIEVEESQSNAI